MYKSSNSTVAFRNLSVVDFIYIFDICPVHNFRIRIRSRTMFLSPIECQSVGKIV